MSAETIDALARAVVILLVSITAYMEARHHKASKADRDQLRADVGFLIELLDAHLPTGEQPPKQTRRSPR